MWFVYVFALEIVSVHAPERVFVLEIVFVCLFAVPWLLLSLLTRT